MAVTRASNRPSHSKLAVPAAGAGSFAIALPAHASIVVTAPADDSSVSVQDLPLLVTPMSGCITLAEKFAQINDHWNPRIAAELNGQHVKLVRILGEFDWHSHAGEDELFLVHRGEFRMEFRDRHVTLRAGDMIVVPRGIEHRPVAEAECEIILFEPASTLNTGDTVSAKTRAVLDRI